MAITTYAELQTAIANWLSRSDLTDRIPEFIDLAEGYIRTDLYDSQMETRAYATTTAGNNYLGLPTAFRSMRRMQIVNAGVEYLIQQRSPSEMPLYDDGSTDIPKYFTIVGDQFQLWPKPNAAYRVEITYHKDVPSLSDSNTTNWLLTDFPHVYLYAALRHGAIFMFDDAQLVRYTAMYKEAFDQLLAQDQKRRYGSHPLRIKAL